ncbi:MAG: aminotransferase class V-fold PLP-dependent enzyme [Minisyncoccia bacterium]
MKRTYLDFAAAAPVLPEARRAFLRALASYGNPSSFHEEGRKAREILEGARRHIARIIGVEAHSVLFTSGATEGNALAIEGHFRARIASGERPETLRMLYLPGAHASLMGAVARVAALGVSTKPLVLAGSALNFDLLKEELREGVALIAVEAVSAETGVRFDTRGIRRAIDTVGAPGKTFLHVDGSQLPLIESCVRTRLGADLLTLDAQKVGGIRGVGVLIRQRGTPLSPLVLGGGQEEGMRPGTPSPALACAFAVALTTASETHERFFARATHLRAKFLARILPIENLMVNEGEKQAPHIVNVSLLSCDTDYLLALLDARGFAVSTKSACESDSAEGSRAVLAQMGDAARARSTLRISWGRETAEADLIRFADALIHSVSFMNRTSV